MKNLVVISVVLAIVALILGIITQLVGKTILVSAAGWNSLTQTLLLFAIAFAVWAHECCKKE
ncbi:MAG: hypothetical protein PHC43_08185 [Candidatus Marinimicrobia bacterium]|jgi:uncharacterized membrane protein|nr:hypothetical protein [Candidatus Neomarinimicrobiota bacterium]MCK9559521.1 hypothetical protein [Candidatus Neomarinimicrobiota bacterium]MDD5231291.1 hypothetical protein [Candidatus Neomarinimicrobiota bacterium]MDD5540734.1 hypothetical protein [Candidatus Neomarinimicrobiota bacterium]